MPFPSESRFTRISSALTFSITPSAVETTTTPESLAALYSIPVPIIGASAFNYCTSLKTITFEGNSLTHIDNWAFSDCPIKSIYIPASVIQIGWGAFSCPQLQEIHMLGENPPTVGNSSPFANFNATLYVPKGCATKYWAAPIWGDFKNIVEE